MDGQLCYQADLESLRDEVEDKKATVVDKKKVVTEGLVFWLDYNENRMVEEGGKQKDGHEDAVIHIGTIGKNYEKSQ